MSKVFEGLCHLLAPILCFTADEAWEHAGHDTGDIHACTFPEPDPLFSGTVATDKINTLITYRNIIQKAIEPLRQEKIIRANEEASVQLSLPEGAESPFDILGDEDAVKEFFIVSELDVSFGTETPVATAKKSNFGKCPRCWRLSPEVTSEDTLCHRCIEAIGSHPFSKRV